jgi:hypothetical protein
MSVNISNLTGYTIIDGNPADYGLEPAAATATATYKDGSTVTVKIGGLTPDELYFYCMVEGDDNIYTIHFGHGQRITCGLNEFFNSAITDIAFNDIISSIFSINGEAYGYIMGFPDSVEFMGWQRETFVSNQTAPGMIVDTNYIYNELYAGFNEFTLSGYVENVSDNLSEYGLEEPSMTLYLETMNQTLGLLFGDSDGNGNRYINFMGEPYVYTIAEEQLTNLMSFDKSRYFDRRLINVAPIQAETVKVSHNGSVTGGTEITIEPMADEADAESYAVVYELFWDDYADMVTAEERVNPVWTVDIDGNVKPENFNPVVIYNNEGNFTENEDGSLSYHMTYEFFEFNEAFYEVSVNGEAPHFLISKVNADKLAELF